MVNPKHVYDNATYQELKWNELNNELESGCAKHVQRKLEFIQPHKEWMLAENLSSSFIKKQMQEMRDEAAEISGSEDVYSRLDTDIESAAFRSGAKSGSMYDGPPILDNPSFVSVLLVVTKWVREYVHASAVNGELADTSVGFKLSSSPGFDDFGSQLNCEYSGDIKRAVMEESFKADLLESLNEGVRNIVLKGFRLQFDTAEKAALRPSFYIDGGYGSPFVHGTVLNPNHGFRIRIVDGFSMKKYQQLVAVNQSFMKALKKHERLKEYFDHTHDTITEQFKGQYVVCADIANNDMKFPPELVLKIVELVLPPQMFEYYEQMRRRIEYYGAYFDEDTASRYYKITDAIFGIMSGDPFTTLVNKIGHVTNQLWTKLMLYEGVEDLKSDHPALLREYTESDIVNLKEVTTTKNGGDDTSDGFFSREDALRYSLLIQTNPYFDIGLEDPSFVGIGFITTEYSEESKVGLMSGVGYRSTTAFVKPIEKTERRSYTHPLSSHYLISLRGRIEFLEQYGSNYDPRMVAETIDWNCRLVDYVGTQAELVKITDKLQLDLAKTNPRQAAINEALKILGITDSNRLNYDYTYDELATALPAHVMDQLALTWKMEQVVRDDYLLAFEQESYLLGDYSSQFETTVNEELGSEIQEGDNTALSLDQEEESKPKAEEIESTEKEG